MSQKGLEGKVWIHVACQILSIAEGWILSLLDLTSAH